VPLSPERISEQPIGKLDLREAIVGDITGRPAGNTRESDVRRHSVQGAAVGGGFFASSACTKAATEDISMRSPRRLMGDDTLLMRRSLPT
jgi:hypothetical protein